MTVDFLASAKPGLMIGEAKVTQLGQMVAFIEGKLTAADGTLLATASSCTRLIEAAKAFRQEMDRAKSALSIASVCQVPATTEDEAIS